MVIPSLLFFAIVVVVVVVVVVFFSQVPVADHTSTATNLGAVAVVDGCRLSARTAAVRGANLTTTITTNIIIIIIARVGRCVGARGHILEALHRCTLFFLSQNWRWSH